MRAAYFAPSHSPNKYAYFLDACFAARGHLCRLPCARASPLCWRSIACELANNPPRAQQCAHLNASTESQRDISWELSRSFTAKRDRRWLQGPQTGRRCVHEGLR